MKVQKKKAHTSAPAPKHLVTKLEFKVKPHKGKTKFLRARVDTCADVNLMPVSIYKKLLKDEDCNQIATSKLQLATYTTKKVKIIGSCKLFIMHPDTKYLEETRLYVATNEGSILISCETSLALSLIKPHKKLDHPPPKGNKNIIYSSADKVKKRDESQLKVQQTKLKTNAQKIANGCAKGEQSQKENKNNQAKSVNMQPKKPQTDVQSQEPTKQSSSKEKHSP